MFSIGHDDPAALHQLQAEVGGAPAVARADLQGAPRLAPPPKRKKERGNNI